MNIFVSIGTHEAPMDRLIRRLDKLVENRQLKIFIQYGYSTPPSVCEGKDFISYSEMEQRIKDADIVVTHGGPGTIIDSIEKNKKTIVVPRQKKYGEHVDDHQVFFSKRLSEEGKVLLCLNVDEELESLISSKNNHSSDYVDLENTSSNNKDSITRFEKYLKDYLLEKKGIDLNDGI